MTFDNKMVNRMAQDALVCAPDLEREFLHSIRYQVLDWTKSKYLVDRHRIQSTFRFMKICLFLNQVIAYGLGWIDSMELCEAYAAWRDEDRRYWDRGDLEITCEGWYHVGMHPALNHRRLLPMY